MGKGVGLLGMCKLGDSSAKNSAGHGVKEKKQTSHVSGGKEKRCVGKMRKDVHATRIFVGEDKVVTFG